MSTKKEKNVVDRLLGLVKAPKIGGVRSRNNNSVRRIRELRESKDKEQQKISDIRSLFGKYPFRDLQFQKKEMRKEWE